MSEKALDLHKLFPAKDEFRECRNPECRRLFKFVSKRRQPSFKSL